MVYQRTVNFLHNLNFTALFSGYFQKVIKATFRIVSQRHKYKHSLFCSFRKKILTSAGKFKLSKKTVKSYFFSRKRHKYHFKRRHILLGCGRRGNPHHWHYWHHWQLMFNGSILKAKSPQSFSPFTPSTLCV